MHMILRQHRRMRAVLPIHTALIDEPQIRFVYESRGLQSMAYALFVKLSSRDQAQLRVHEWDELAECRRVALTPFGEQRRHIGWRSHRNLGTGVHSIRAAGVNRTPSQGLTCYALTCAIY